MFEQSGTIYSLMNERTIPYGVSLEVTAKCNLDCVHCYHVRSEGPELDSGEMKSLLGQLAYLGSMELTFTGGEPFLRSNFTDIVRFAVREKGFSVKIFSNLTLLDAPMADILASLPLNRVETTMLGPTSEIHDSLAGKRGSFDAMMRGIRLLLERKVTVAAKTLLMKKNYNQLEKMYRIAAELGISFRHDDGIFVETDGGRRPLGLRISKIDMLRNRRGTEFRSNGKTYHSCNAAKSVLHISPDGSVFPCGPFPVSAGNVRTTSISEIWRDSPLMRRVRSLTNSDYTVCGDCRYKIPCAGCMAMGYGLSSGRMYPCRVVRRKLRPLL